MKRLTTSLASPLLAALCVVVAGAQTLGGPAPSPSPAAGCADYPKKALSSPIPMAVSPNGTVYVLIGGAKIFRFAPGAKSGDEPLGPLCAAPPLPRRGVGLGATSGAVFELTAGAIAVFPAASEGPVPPSRFIGDPAKYPTDTVLNSNMGPYEMAVGADGSVYALTDTSCHCHAGGSQDTILTFPPAASGDGAAVRSTAPSYRGSAGAVSVYVDALALDPSSRLFVHADDGDLVVSRPGAVAPFAREARVPISRGFVPHLAIDDADTAYVAEGPTVYAVTGAAGATPHVAQLAGAKTRITNAEGIGTDASRKLYVENCAGARTSILVFAPHAIGNVAPLSVLAAPHIGLTCDPDATIVY